MKQISSKYTLILQKYNVKLYNNILDIYYFSFETTCLDNLQVQL
jgi:hypothetical protein